MKPLRCFAADSNGATSIEYGIIAALMAVVIIASIAVLGNPVEGLFGGARASLVEAQERLPESP